MRHVSPYPVSETVTIPYYKNIGNCSDKLHGLIGYSKTLIRHFRKIVSINKVFSIKNLHKMVVMYTFMVCETLKKLHYLISIKSPLLLRIDIYMILDYV